MWATQILGQRVKDVKNVNKNELDKRKKILFRNKKVGRRRSLSIYSSQNKKCLSNCIYSYEDSKRLYKANIVIWDND